MSAPSFDVPPKPLYHDPGWIVVVGNPIEGITIARSWLIKQTDEIYRQAAAFVEGMTLASTEEHDADPGWVGARIIAEVWGSLK